MSQWNEGFFTVFMSCHENVPQKCAYSHSLSKADVVDVVIWRRRVYKVWLHLRITYVLPKKSIICQWYDPSVCLQVPGPRDGSGLRCRLGVHSRDATRWKLGGPLVQEADKRMSLFADFLNTTCTMLYLSIIFSAKGQRFSSQCDHRGWGRHGQKWHSDYIWHNQKGKLVHLKSGLCFADNRID